MHARSRNAVSGVCTSRRSRMLHEASGKPHGFRRSPEAPATQWVAAIAAALQQPHRFRRPTASCDPRGSQITILLVEAFALAKPSIVLGNGDVAGKPVRRRRSSEGVVRRGILRRQWGVLAMRPGGSDVPLTVGAAPPSAASLAMVLSLPLAARPVELRRARSRAHSESSAQRATTKLAALWACALCDPSPRALERDMCGRSQQIVREKCRSSFIPCKRQRPKPHLVGRTPTACRSSDASTCATPIYVS